MYRDNLLQNSNFTVADRTTLRELIFAGINFGVFADLGPNNKIKFPQNFSNSKNKSRIIHRTALIFFKLDIRKIKFPQKISKLRAAQKLVPLRWYLETISSYFCVLVVPNLICTILNPHSERLFTEACF